LATPQLTNADVGWAAIMLALILPAQFGAMFGCAAYITPWLLGVANCTERDAFGQAIEFVCLFAGLIFGCIVGLALSGAMFRRFASTETRARWRRHIENDTFQKSSIYSWLGAYVLRFLGA
jgi:hypothetical protein